MTSDMPSLGDLSDRDLLALVDQAVGHERQATARLIALLMEVDARKLYLKLGCSSLFTYCVQVLHLSEHAAYLRIEAARATRAFPVILERLADGSLHLTAISLLRPHLTPANHLETLDAARHKSKRDVEQLIARMRPQSDVPSVVRKLPAPKPAALPPRSLTSEAYANSFAAVAPPIVTPSTRPPEVKLLALERYKVQFTVSRETYNKLRQVQDLLRHTIPNGDPAAIFDRALTLLLAEVMKTKLAATDRPRQGRRTLTPSPIFQPQSNARCGVATADSAHLGVTTAAARKLAFWSSIMWCLMREGARRRSRISSCVVGRTTYTRRSSNSGHIRRCYSCARLGRCTVLHIELGPDRVQRAARVEGIARIL